MTICKQCKQKIEGKTCYWKAKAVCSSCFHELKNRRPGGRPTTEYYLKWLKAPQNALKCKKEVSENGHWSNIKSIMYYYNISNINMYGDIMKSTQDIKKVTGLNNAELLETFRDCIRYYLSEEELQPFLEKAISYKFSKGN